MLAVFAFSWLLLNCVHGHLCDPGKYVAGTRRNILRDEAAAECQEKGMSLAKIETQHENSQASCACVWSGVHGTACWIGARRRQSGSSQFVWDDGTPVTKANWYPGQPVSNGDCVHANWGFDATKFQWGVMDCSWTETYMVALCEKKRATQFPASPSLRPIEKKPRQIASILIQGDPTDCEVHSRIGGSTDLIKIEKAGTLAAITLRAIQGGLMSHPNGEGGAFWGNDGVNEFIVAVGHRMDPSAPFKLIYPRNGTKNFDGLVARENMYRMKNATTKDDRLVFAGPSYQVSVGDELRFCGLNSFSKSFLTGDYGGTTFAKVYLFYEEESSPGITGLFRMHDRLLGAIALATLLIVLCVVAPVMYVQVKRRNSVALKDASGRSYGATTTGTQGL